MKNQQVIDRLTAIANKATTDIFVTLDGDTESWNIRNAEELHNYRDQEYSEPIDRDNLPASIAKAVNKIQSHIDHWSDSN
jgi:hypothetical protein